MVLDTSRWSLVEGAVTTESIKQLKFLLAIKHHHYNLKKWPQGRFGMTVAQRRARFCSKSIGYLSYAKPFSSRKDTLSLWVPILPQTLFTIILIRLGCFYFAVQLQCLINWSRITENTNWRDHSNLDFPSLHRFQI